MGNELQGTIDRIDLPDQYFVLTQSDRATSSLVNRDDNTRIYFDDRTSVTYEGETYRPEDLEEGDQVAVRVSRSGDRLFATSMRVLRNASGSSGMQNGTRTTQLQGTVQDVDPVRRTIEIDPGLSRRSVTVWYDANTSVEHDGRRYDPEDLERGDEVRIDVREAGRGQLLADSISVARNTVGDSYRKTMSTVRGTVRDIDLDRQTIDLEQTRLGSSFNPGNESLLTLQYDANTIVEYQGDRYSPTHIERGDVVDVEVQDLGRRQFAQRIVVVRDARALR
jgi:predicted RNA-binding protein with TRAM domain/predicted RNA-binding protein